MPEETNQNAPPVADAKPQVSKPVIANTSAPSAEEKPVDASTFSLGSGQKKQEGSLLQKLLGQKNGNGAGQSTALPAVAEGNVFTQLLQSDKTTTSVAPSPSIAQLLGSRPNVSAQELEAAKEAGKRRARNIFAVAVFLCLGVYSFFYTQLQPDFTLLADIIGPSVGSKFEQSNAEIAKIQTDINLLRFRTARLELDELYGIADAYGLDVTVSEAPTSSEIQEQEALMRADEQSGILNEKIAQLRRLIAQPMGIDLFSREPITPEQREEKFEALLIDALKQQRSALSGGESRTIEAVEKLVSNKTFRTVLKSGNVEKMTHAERNAFLKKLRAESGDEFSSIEKIRAQRIAWSRLLSDIHAVVRKADPLYGQGLFKTVGGFVFSAYRFDVKSARVGLTGTTKTSHSKTFSAITQLVDAVEKSPQFKDIDFRSFAKSRDESTGDFSSSVNIEFSLQSGPDPRDDIISLIPNP